MTINPRDYNLDELREMARKRGEDPADLAPPETPERKDWGSASDAGSVDADRSSLYHELLPLEASIAGTLQKPYLERLPDTYAGEFLVFEWLEFLMNNAGYRGAQDALSYYESVGWITETVESDLGEYVRGIEDAVAAEGKEMDVDDHMLSLVYIAKLVSMT